MPTGRGARVPRRAARARAERRRRRALRSPRRRRRSATCSASRARSTRWCVGEAQILGQLKAAYGVAGGGGHRRARCSARCLERAFGVAKRVRTETAIARGAANVSSVAVELAARVFGDLAGKRVLVVGAGKMSTLAARHLYASGAQRDRRHQPLAREGARRSPPRSTASPGRGPSSSSCSPRPTS